jgi:hypothetical protein
MIPSQYNKRRHNSPSGSLWAGLGFLGIAGLMIWNWEPDMWWKEGLMVVFVFTALIFLVSKLLGNNKLGWIFSTGIVGLLIFNRLNILDLLSVVLLITLLGLITLVN